MTLVKLLFTLSFLLPYGSNYCVPTFHFNSLMPDYQVETFTVTTKDLYNLVLFKIDPKVRPIPEKPLKGTFVIKYDMIIHNLEKLCQERRLF